MMQKEISCGVIPVYKTPSGDNEFLLVELHHGGISFPKGHMESGETYLETAKRELLEETGLVADSLIREHIISESYTIIRPEKRILKTVHYFIGFVDTQKISIQESEVKNAYWLSFPEALSKINHVESREVLKKAHDYLMSL